MNSKKHIEYEEETNWPARAPAQEEFERVLLEARRIYDAFYSLVLETPPLPVCFDVGWLLANDGSARWRVCIENENNPALAAWIQAGLNVMVVLEG